MRATSGMSYIECIDRMETQCLRGSHVTHFIQLGYVWPWVLQRACHTLCSMIDLVLGGNMCRKLDLTLRSKDAHTHTCDSGCFLMWQTHVGCTIMMVTLSRWPQVNHTIMIVPSSNDLMSIIYSWWLLLKTMLNWLQHDDGTFTRLLQIDGFFKLVTPSSGSHHPLNP